MSSGNTLESQAASRKERLAQLRSLKRKAEGQSVEEQEDDKQRRQNEKEEVFIGRNYDEKNRAPKVGFEEAPTEGQETVELVAEELEQDALNKLTSRSTAELELSSLQPKSVNWDLKRDLESKLSILDARTDNAIIRMVKDRLQNVKADD